MITQTWQSREQHRKSDFGFAGTHRVPSHQLQKNDAISIHPCIWKISLNFKLHTPGALGNRVESSATGKNSTSLTMERMFSGSVPSWATTTELVVGSVAMKTTPKDKAKSSYQYSRLYWRVASDLIVWVGRLTSGNSTLVTVGMENLNTLHSVTCSPTGEISHAVGRTIRCSWK